MYQSYNDMILGQNAATYLKPVQFCFDGLKVIGPPRFCGDQKPVADVLNRRGISASSVQLSLVFSFLHVLVRENMVGAEM